MQPLLNIAVNAALEAGKIIYRDLDFNLASSAKATKKGRNDYVTEIDRLAEQVIIDVIRKAYPDHGFIAEEGTASGEAEVTWIIDPLDGTTNFIHGFPHFAVSIAARVGNRVEHGVVYNPVNQELFSASRGCGAYVNNRRIRASKQLELKGSLIGTGFPFKKPSLFDPYMNSFSSVFKQVSDIRRTGSAALDLAYVAAGRLDGFWEMGLQPWDIAAGSLLVQEAGGVVTDFAGNSNFLTTGNIVAGSLKVHAALHRTLNKSLPAEHIR